MKEQAKTKTVVQRGISELYSGPSQLLGVSDSSDLQISKQSESDFNLSRLAEEMKSVDKRPSRNRGVLRLARKDSISMVKPFDSFPDVDKSAKSHVVIDYSMSVLAEELQFEEEKPKRNDVSQLISRDSLQQSVSADLCNDSEHSGERRPHQLIDYSMSVLADSLDDK